MNSGSERIRTIVFDLGGVLLNVDYENTINAFRNLGMEQFDAFFTQASQDALFDKLDKGEITPAEFRNAIRRFSGLRIGDDQIDAAWNAMLGEFPPHRLELLQLVRNHYRTFLLSNTNAIHYPVYTDYMKRRFGMEDLGQVFEKQYLSYRIGLRKPDKAVFDHVVRENGLDPGETLFIDDSIQHVRGARQAGLQAVHLDVQTTDIADLFSKNGLLSHPVPC